MTDDAFQRFFERLHGFPPFAWQVRAARELATDGWWPAVVAPTGAGKTALITCWLHALARSGPDLLGRRLIWVVDRRSVVDQVFQYADGLASHLATDDDTGVRAVADALRRVGAGSEGGADKGLPVRSVIWRGGMDDEASLALRDPLDPAAISIVVSTVDQLGSRLLFRGYGLRNGSRALHAGLLGLDTTVVVDEAHLSEPLRETVGRVGRIQTEAHASPRPPLRVCSVSATHAPPTSFSLSGGELAEQSIAMRVQATKLASMARGWRPIDVVRAVSELAEQDEVKVVGVVLNTVTEARAAFDALAKLHLAPRTDCVLLIGPARSLERADLIDAIPGRDERADRTKPYVVVATQTIEVGIDLDFDALVTAAAPLDALVQRFGRLDRAGRRGTSRAVILPPPSKGCPVYGEATTATWEWLERAAHGTGDVDFGVQALRTLVEERGTPPPPEPARTIALLPEHVDALSVTDGLDHEGPEIDLLLHGDRPASREIAVVWRAGLEHLDERSLQTELKLVPIHPAEILSLPLSVFRRWLDTGAAAPFPDVESLADEGPAKEPGRHDPPPAWIVEADSEVRRVNRASDVGPGCRVVLPASAGGLDEFGWAPSRGALPPGQAVPDLSALSGRGPRMVLDRTAAGAVAEGLEAGELTPRSAARELFAAIDEALPGSAPGQHHLEQRIQAAKESLRAGRAELLDDGRVLVTGRGARSNLAGSGTIVTLRTHQAAVAQRVSEVLDALSLDDEIASSLGRAARNHDEGKRDPRFQKWLLGGSAKPVEEIAKSAYPYSRERVERLRVAAGWPRGKRHELLSALGVQSAFPEDELAVWLAATHHGHHRPFMTVREPDDLQEAIKLDIDGQPHTVPASATLDPAAQLDIWARLTSRFGPWGLAFLEAVLIGADRGISAEEGA